jgi:hypothetical protein
MTTFRQRLAHIATSLEDTFNKTTLQGSYLPLARLLLKNQEALFESEGADKRLIETAISKGAMSKTDMAIICALPFVSKKCYEAFLKILDPDVRKVWEELIWTKHLNSEEIKRKFGIEITRQKEIKRGRVGHISKQVELRDEFGVFLDLGSHFYYSFQQREYTFCLPLNLRRILLEYHDLPAEAHFTPLEKPAPKLLIYESGERDIMLELPRLLTYKGQGQINYTAKKRPSLTSLPKMQRSLNLREFFPNTSHKKLKTLRTYLLAGLLTHVSGRASAAEAHAQIKQIFLGPYVKNAHTAALALCDLKGLGQVEDYYIAKKESELFALLGELPAGRWVSMDNIRQYMKYRLYEIAPVTEHLARNYLYLPDEEVQIDRYFDRNYITPGMYDDAITQPYLKASFFIFAAFGLCDLAYSEPDMEDLGKSVYSSWDGLAYVRRTPLGDYVCGGSKDYDASSLAGAARITLSPDTLLIAGAEDDAGVAGVLEPYAESMGGNRFRTDAQIFLKNIRSKKELESKIILFKQLVGAALPPNWEAFFQDIIHKIDPFELAPDMTLLKIPPDNKELIRLMAQDPVVKTLIIKAEGYLVLVPKGNFAPLKRRLQEFGYLVT